MSYDYDRTKTAGARLDSGKRSRINADLRKGGLDGNGRFRKVGEALAKALAILAKYGIEQDEVVSLYPESKGSRLIDLAFTNPDDSFSPTSIDNSGLYLTWEDLGRNVEVVGYLS